MATFLTPAEAIQSAVDMLHGVDAFNKTLAEPLLYLKIGIHSGASIAVTLNERLDYFGQTVNIAVRIQVKFLQEGYGWHKLLSFLEAKKGFFAPREGVSYICYVGRQAVFRLYAGREVSDIGTGEN